ncbi:MAG: hypothetical protein EZS28_041313, partial [Streblomastix strix]
HAKCTSQGIHGSCCLICD